MKRFNTMHSKKSHGQRNSSLFTVHCSLFIAIFSLLIANCSLPEMHAPKPGYLYINIDTDSLPRTIRPDLEAEISSYNLYINDTQIGDPIPKNQTFQPVSLEYGTHTVRVTGNFSYGAIAEGIKEIDFNASMQSVTITLKPVINDTLLGTFSWDISFDDFTPYEAEMRINTYPGNILYNNDIPINNPIDILTDDTGEIIGLPAGSYYLVTSIKKDETSDPVIWTQILHIYQYLTSHFEFEFTEESFASNGIEVGDGSIENPFRIYTVEDLKAVGRGGTDGYETGKYSGWTNYDCYTLMKDIELPIVAAGSYNWQTIPSTFYGVFDGNGNKIINMTIIASGNNVYHGMFSEITSTVENLSLVNISITHNSAGSNSYTGGITGVNSGAIINCYVSGNITGSGSGSIGGIAGGNNTSTNIENSYTDVNINITGTSNSGVGGIVGWGNTNTSILNCYSLGNITGNSNVAGIAGNFGGTINNCVVLSESITGNSTVGRIYGNGTSSTSNNYARSDVPKYANSENRDGADIESWYPSWFRSTPGPGWTNPPWTDDRLPSGAAATFSDKVMVLDHATSVTTTYVDLQAAVIQNAFAAGRDYKVTVLADQEIGRFQPQAAKIHIEGSGTMRTIKFASNLEPLFVIYNVGCIVTIGKNITLEGKPNSIYPLVAIGASGHFIMEEGSVITKNITSYYGGGVYIENGTFTMNGGSITDNKTNYYGGGVYVAEDGTFIMNGGTIDNNEAVTGGGVETNGYFKMTGGVISDNEAGSGGGVCIDEKGVFDMFNGEIANNKANSDDKLGGGVYIVDDGQFNMKGGEITWNTADWGGGVYVDETAVFTMDNGLIYKNDANLGGGVYVWGEFDMNDGEITDNTATANGGGVYISYHTSYSPSEGTFKMFGGTILENTAASNGGGIFIYYGSFDMEDGTIIGNKAVNGAGVYVDSGCKFSMSGGEIKGNNASSNGGGVYVAYAAPGQGGAGIFTKSNTGGIIFGNNADNSDDRNTANQGNAVFVDGQNAGSIKRRETTALQEVLLNSGLTAAQGGGWE